jgi:hypothetical protein
MSDYRREGETVEQYALRVLSDLADGDVGQAVKLACQYCTGPSSMGLCEVLQKTQPSNGGEKP